ncbi:MAG: diaminopimelate epimerase [Alphaproteobacteria bacterium]|nr:diaminopimelate epimerase [Alphaproteobacteria bacterium]
MISFFKMHGLGNDFVLIDCRDSKQHGLRLSKKDIQILGDRHRGIGFDQIIFIRVSEKADAYMDMYNADGGLIEACGNGTRCLAGFLMDEQNKSHIKIETPVDILFVERSNLGTDYVTVNMGQASFPELSQDNVDCNNLPLSLSYTEEKISCCGVSVGNPHAVFFVSDVSRIDIEKEGKIIENHILFPNKTNVEFVQKIDDFNLRMRVWERGTGITQACGTGACATVVGAIRTINSRLYTWYHLKVHPKAKAKTSIPKILVGDIRQLPIPEISKEQQKEFVEIVDQIMEAKKKDPNADTSELENKIDDMVYDLYNLTDEERKIVEGE